MKDGRRPGVFHFDPARWLRFIYLPAFEQKVKHFGLGADFMRAVEAAILDDPRGGPVMQGTGGLRKLRLARPGEGKRGSFRLCYVYFERHGIAVVVTLFSKAELSDISARERSIIARLIRDLESQLERGMIQ